MLRFFKDDRYILRDVTVLFILVLLCTGLLSYRNYKIAEENDKQGILEIIKAYTDDCIKGNVDKLSSYLASDSGMETDSEAIISGYFGENTDPFMDNEEINDTMKFVQLIVLRDIIVEDVEIDGNSAEASLKYDMIDAPFLDAPEATMYKAAAQVDNILSEETEDGQAYDRQADDALERMARMSAVTCASFGYKYVDVKLEFTKINGEWKISDEHY